MTNRGRHKKKDDFKELMYKIRTERCYRPEVKAFIENRLESTWYPNLAGLNENDIKGWFKALKGLYHYNKLIINDLIIIL